MLVEGVAESPDSSKRAWLVERQLLGPMLERCAEHHVTIEDLFSRDRTKRVARARHLIWLWLREDLRWSYPEIGTLFGRDDKTVMEGVARAGRELGLAEYEGRMRRVRRAA